MALDFPNSPTNGQIFGAYTWNSARGVWLQTSMSSRVVTTSDTPPASPTNGDMWMYTVDGTCFIYYNDGTSGQWVEQSKSILTPATYQSPNYIINGGFDFWQRSTSATIASGTYAAADRWTFTASGTGISCVQSRQTIVPNQSISYSARYQQSGNATSVTEYRARTWLEVGHIRPLIGNTVTLSFWYRSSITGTHSARTGVFNATGSGLDSTVNFTVSSADTWQYVTTTHSSFSNVTGFSVGETSAGAFVDIGYGSGTTSVPTGSNFYLAEVQLEAGSVATPFRRNAPTLQAELAACQRYYQFHDFIVGSGDSAGYKFATNPLGQLLRATPTITAATTGGPSQSPVYSAAGTNQAVFGKGAFYNGQGATAGAFVIFTNVTVNAEL